MPSEVTRILDVIVPEVFTPYTILRTMQLSALYQSGIVVNDPAFDALASQGGSSLINMPYWADLSGDSEIMDDTGNVTTAKIGTGQDMARKQARARAWAANNLAGYLAGDDPMRVIGDLVAGYWTREMQTILIAQLAGVFGAASMAGNVLDITALAGNAAKISSSAFIDATQLLGDAKGQLTGFVMHSATEAALAKLQLIQYAVTIGETVVLASTPTGASDRVPFFMGHRVIVDDGCPVDTENGVYTSYIFGEGAFALGNGTPTGIQLTETYRNSLSLAGEDDLITRKVFLLHPRGVKWTETDVAAKYPTNTELKTATNWTRVYDSKKIRIVKFLHKL
ncbi:MAG TPA: major capsid protein [Armatimonadota bacterium]|jgi:hypothetical protein